MQTTTWIRFIRDDEVPERPCSAEPQERIEKAFNSLMTSVYRGSDLDQIVDGMIENMKFQIENPAQLTFVFDEVLFLDTIFIPLILPEEVCIFHY